MGGRKKLVLKMAVGSEEEEVDGRGKTAKPNWDLCGGNEMAAARRDLEVQEGGNLPVLIIFAAQSPFPVPLSLSAN